MGWGGAASWAAMPLAMAVWVLLLILCSATIPCLRLYSAMVSLAARCCVRRCRLRLPCAAHLN